jgi:hypothetical protein
MYSTKIENLNSSNQKWYMKSRKNTYLTWTKWTFDLNENSAIVFDNYISTAERTEVNEKKSRRKAHKNC